MIGECQPWVLLRGKRRDKSDIGFAFVVLVPQMTVIPVGSSAFAAGIGMPDAFAQSFSFCIYDFW